VLSVALANETHLINYIVIKTLEEKKTVHLIICCISTIWIQIKTLLVDKTAPVEKKQSSRMLYCRLSNARDILSDWSVIHVVIVFQIDTFFPNFPDSLKNKNNF